jgi:hypothetical protein
VLRRRPDDAPTLTDRAAPLIEEAAERSRVSWRTRVERLRLAWRSIFQASVSAALAWLIATKVLGHPTPFFAPVAAIITLGITVGQRGQRAAEVALGVALGIAIADLLVIQIGTGTAQLALVVALATSAAIFLGSGQMLATQAAVSAALVATLQPPTDGVSFARFLDALVGGGVALTINALVLPARPLDLMQRASTPLLAELAAVLDDVAIAVERRDQELAVKALAHGESIADAVFMWGRPVQVIFDCIHRFVQSGFWNRTALNGDVAFPKRILLAERPGIEAEPPGNDIRMRLDGKRYIRHARGAVRAGPDFVRIHRVGTHPEIRDIVRTNRMADTRLHPGPEMRAHIKNAKRLARYDGAVLHHPGLDIHGHRQPESRQRKRLLPRRDELNGLARFEREQSRKRLHTQAQFGPKAAAQLHRNNADAGHLAIEHICQRRPHLVWGLGGGPDIDPTGRVGIGHAGHGFEVALINTLRAKRVI